MKLKVVCPTVDDAELGEVLCEVDDGSGETKAISIGTIFWTRRGYSVEVEVLLGASCDRKLADKIRTLVKRAYEKKYRVEKIVLRDGRGERFEYLS